MIIFLIAVTLSLILTIIIGVKLLKKGVNANKYMFRSVIVGIILVPIVGKAEGTFYSHGFDIPWWVFGAVNLLVITTAAITTGVIYKLFASKIITNS